MSATSTQSVSTYEFQQLDTTIAAERTPGDALSAAWAEADQIREQARQEGRDAGYAEGLTRARQETLPVLQSLSSAVAEVAATRSELTETLTRQAAELALTVAEQILTTAVAVEPERVVDVTRGALRRLTDRHQLTVLVSPHDLEILGDAVSGLQAELGGIEHLEVQADRRVAAGGCLIRAAYGEIDATITTQLQHAAEIVKAALIGDPGASDEDANPSAARDGV